MELEKSFRQGEDCMIIDMDREEIYGENLKKTLGFLFPKM